MKNIFHFFFHTPDGLQLFMFSGLFLLCWNIENLIGLTTNYKKWKHATINSKFIISGIPVQFTLGIIIAKTVQWNGLHHFGIVNHVPFKNPIVLLIITFLILDFGEFIYHVIMHKVKRLWMFHLVHHSDRIVDVSTTLREHPAESFIRISFTLVWIFISGVTIWPLLIRQLIQLGSNLFAHMNFRIPEKIDNIVGLVFITPNLHHVHHHYKQPYTDCNYGDVLSIWDRLFGTFCRLPSNEVIFGVDVFMDTSENTSYGSLLKIPFGKYRNSKEIVFHDHKEKEINGQKDGESF